MKNMALWVANYSRQIDNTDNAPLIVIQTTTIGTDEKLAVVGYQFSTQDGDDANVYVGRIDGLNTLPTTPAALTKTLLTPYSAITFPSIIVQSTPLDASAITYNFNYDVQYFNGRKPITVFYEPKNWIWLNNSFTYDWLAFRIVSSHATLTNASCTIWLRSS